MSETDPKPEHPRLALEQEVAFFNVNRERWVQEGHEGKWFAVTGETVLGIFETMTDAYSAGVSQVGSNPFLVKQLRREDQLAIIKRANLRKRA